MTEKSSLTASAVASKLDANVNFIQGPCRAAGINAFKAQCIPPAQLVVLILFLKGSVPSPAPHPFSRKAGCFMFEPNIFCKYFREQSLLKKEPYLKIKLLTSAVKSLRNLQTSCANKRKLLIPTIEKSNGYVKFLIA